MSGPSSTASGWTLSANQVRRDGVDRLPGGLPDPTGRRLADPDAREVLDRDALLVREDRWDGQRDGNERACPTGSADSEPGRGHVRSCDQGVDVAQPLPHSR
jgi:hypothetical protein